jgi:hypothetical protein
MLREEREERRYSHPSQGGCLGSLLDALCSLIFLNVTLPCKISKQNLADMLHEHQCYLQKFSV